MAKRVTKGFAAKTAKALADSKRHCPVCGDAVEMVKHIVAISDGEKKAMRFKEKMERVCSCNRNDIFK